MFKKYLKHFILESWDLQICMTFIRTSFTCFSKLDGIAANTAKCINYQIALTSDCYVLGHLLGRGRKPTFCIINEAVKKLGVLPLQRHYDCLPWSITIPSSYREKSLYRWDQYFFKWPDNGSSLEGSRVWKSTLIPAHCRTSWEHCSWESETSWHSLDEFRVSWDPLVAILTSLLWCDAFNPIHIKGT